VAGSKFLQALSERVLVFDGAMGTNLQNQNLTAEDFGGKDGCNEVLVLTRPGAVAKVHESFFEKNPYSPYCTLIIRPKMEKVRREFGIGK